MEADTGLKDGDERWKQPQPHSLVTVGGPRTARLMIEGRLILKDLGVHIHVSFFLSACVSPLLEEDLFIRFRWPLS